MSKKKVALACSECGSRNYSITENVNRAERLEVKKVLQVLWQTYDPS